MFYQASDFVEAPNSMVLLMIISVIVTITFIFGGNVFTVFTNFKVLFLGWIRSLFHFDVLYSKEAFLNNENIGLKNPKK